MLGVSRPELKERWLAWFLLDGSASCTPHFPAESGKMWAFSLCTKAVCGEVSIASVDNL